LLAWTREFERWAPDLNVIPYIGLKKSREVIRDWEFYLGNTKQTKFHVLLTTYELLLKDNDIFKYSTHRFLLRITPFQHRYLFLN